MKRWWTGILTVLQKEMQKAERNSYRHRFVIDHPDHEEAKGRKWVYREALRRTKDEHWVGWLESLDAAGVWDAGCLVMGPATDGGRTRVPTLVAKDTVTGCVQEATSNEEKSALLYKEFFPQKMEVACRIVCELRI
jgi:hypothetical protein